MNAPATPTLPALASIRMTLDVILEPGTVAELRIPETQSGTGSGYFTELDLLAKAAGKLDGRAPAIYVTANPVKRDLLARAVNRLKFYARHTTADVDILRRRWFLVDCDPKRAPGISSTDAEHDAALGRARAIRDTLTAAGWPSPIFADSGNGAHLLWRVDAPNDDACRDILKRCLEALAFQFDDEAVNVDVTTYNAARIWKLYGTLACKGDSTPDRPHRRAALLGVPEALAVVPRELLEPLAARAPSAHRPAVGSSPMNGTRLDVGAWCAAHGLSVAFSAPWQGGSKTILNVCPWNPVHTNRSAYIIQFPDGGVGAGCHHNGCAGKGWPDLRDLVEPGWREREKRPRAVAACDGADLVDAPMVVNLATVAPEAVTWLWPGRIARGKLTLVVGDPGLGKSYLTQDAAARTTRGLPWPDGSIAPCGDVVILTAEDGLADTIRPRFDALNGDPARVYVLTAIRTGDRERGVDLSQDLAHLESLMARVRARLVVVDPVSAYLGKADSYRDTEVRAVLAPVAGLAERTGAAIIGVMHLTKGQQRQAIHRTQGNVAFVAAARAVFAVAEDREDPTRRLFLPVKMNIAPKPPGLAYRLVASGDVARLEWETEPVDVTADDALAGPELPGDRSEREEAKSFLRDLLADGPVSANEVKKAARGAGIADRTLFRAKTDLSVRVEKTGFRDGWTWTLPAKAAKNAEDCHAAMHAEVGNLGNLRGDGGNLREPLDTSDLEEVGGLWEPARS